MTITALPWCYDEFKQVGKDYASAEEVAVYDATHAEFRDVAAENEAILDRLSLAAGDCIVDFGAGTGAFAIAAALRGLRVHAVDVSPAMLAYARSRAAEAGATTVQFHHAGFLSYSHHGPPAAAVVTSFAFHHLPDFWKGIALQRIHALLKHGAWLYLHDVVIAEADAVSNIHALIEHQAEAGGDFLRDDAECHFRDEFSTYDWVMDGLLARTGFSVQQKTMQGGVLGTYWCVKCNPG